MAAAPSSAVGVMYATALQQNGLAVQAQAPFGVHFHLADAEWSGGLIDGFTIHLQFDFSPIEMGRGGRPQVGTRDGDALLRFGLARRRHGLDAFAAACQGSVRIQKAGADSHIPSGAAAIFNPHRHLHRSRGRAEFRRGDEHAPQRQAHIARNG